MYTLDDIQKYVDNCNKCGLCKTRNKFVFGEGNTDADIMFIGEAPGYQEDMAGKAFIGPAGQLLTKAINAIGLTREEVYICNILKCRPPKNRDPNEDEIKACIPYLRWQFKLVNPKIIICLGRIAAKTIIEPNIKITKDRGKWYNKNGIWIMPTFHPSAVLRDVNKKPSYWEDFKNIKQKADSLAKI